MLSWDRPSCEWPFGGLSNSSPLLAQCALGEFPGQVSTAGRNLGVCLCIQLANAFARVWLGPVWLFLRFSDQEGAQQLLPSNLPRKLYVMMHLLQHLCGHQLDMF